MSKPKKPKSKAIQLSEVLNSDNNPLVKRIERLIAAIPQGHVIQTCDLRSQLRVASSTLYAVAQSPRLAQFRFKHGSSVWWGSKETIACANNGGSK